MAGPHVEHRHRTLALKRRRELSWSEAMTVELGLLQPSDWTAQWIGPDEPVVPAPGERPGYALHTTFTLDAAPDRARTYATAHGIYELFLNGQRVGDQQLTPGSTSYHTTLQVQTYDVTALLHPGSNTIRAVLTDGWYRGTFGYTRDADMYGTHTAFLAQLEVQAGNGRTVLSAPTRPGPCRRRKSSAPTSWPASASTSGCRRPGHRRRAPPSYATAALKP